MNYIPEIAKLLGVEIGEEFYLKGFDEELLENMYVKKHKFFLKKDGLYYIDDIGKNVKSILLDDVISGTLEIIKLPKPILTDKEKKYLSLIIEPWKNEIKYMVKIGYDDMEYIMIVFDDLKEMPFPHFKKGKYYKGIEPEREYTLEELGL